MLLTLSLLKTTGNASVASLGLRPDSINTTQTLNLKSSPNSKSEDDSPIPNLESSSVDMTPTTSPPPIIQGKRWTCGNQPLLICPSPMESSGIDMPKEQMNASPPSKSNKAAPAMQNNKSARPEEQMNARPEITTNASPPPDSYEATSAALNAKSAPRPIQASVLAELEACPDPRLITNVPNYFIDGHLSNDLLPPYMKGYWTSRTAT